LRRAGPAGIHRAPGRRRLRGLAVAAAAATLVLLSGCIYLRLLELKRQFASFDRHFEADTREGLRITCRKPVLLDEDLAFFRLAPESRQRAGAAERWHFRWVKHPPVPGEDPARHEVTADFVFVDHRLTRVLLPERFFVFVPKPLFLSILRAFGHAQVDRDKRTATARVEENSGPSGGPAPLTPTDLTAMLGAPMEKSDTPEGVLWHYHYRAASPGQRSGRIDVAFTLDRALAQVRRIRGRVFDATLDVSFAPVAAPPAPHDSAR
jgi:hypothetical protein